MIFDGENMFCDKKTLSSATLYSDVLNLGPGESYQPMFLEAFIKGGTGTSATLTATIRRQRMMNSPVPKQSANLNSM